MVARISFKAVVCIEVPDEDAEKIKPIESQIDELVEALEEALDADLAIIDNYKCELLNDDGTPRLHDGAGDTIR